MQIIILADPGSREELLARVPADAPAPVFIEAAGDFTAYTGADAWIDLAFEKNDSRIAVLKRHLPKPVIISSIIHTLDEIHPSFIRINGWPGFLKAGLLEASGDHAREEAEKVFSLLGRKLQWLPDIPGFITARVVAGIIREAYLTVEEGVSTPDDIDIAMKLGTNYPHGPFEWASMIGREKLDALAVRLNRQ